MRRLLSFVFFAAPLPAQHVIIDARYWITTAVDRARIEAPQLQTEIDFQRDLGFADRSFPDFAAAIRATPRHRLKLGFTHFAWEGDQQVEREIQFGNRTYAFGARVISDLRLDHVRVSWTWQFLEAAGGRFRIGPLVEGHGLWFDASLTAPQFSIRASDARTAGFPAAGVAMDAAPHRWLGLFAESAGLSLGRYGYMYNGEAGARISSVRYIGFVAGYRLFRVDPKFDPDYARVKVSGPFVGASFGF